MFGFAVKLPVDSASARAVLAAMESLGKAFGEAGFLGKTTINPESGFFSGGWHGSREDIVEAIAKVSELLELQGDFEADFRAFEGEARVDLDEFGERVLLIPPALLRFPDALVAAIARALAAHKLKESGIEGGQGLSELYALQCGFGLLCANTAVSGYRGSGIEVQGRLGEELLGFALAVSAAWKGEDTLIIKDYLKPEVASTFTKTLRYLSRNGLSVWGRGGKAGGLSGELSVHLEREAFTQSSTGTAKAPDPGSRAATALEPQGERETTIDRVELLGRGSLLADDQVREFSDGEKDYSFPAADLDEIGDRIFHRQGLIIGFAYRVIGSPPGSMARMELLWSHPPLIDIDGEPRTESGGKVNAREGEVFHLGWSFGVDGRPAPGAWSARLSRDGEELLRWDFEVVDEGQDE